MQAKTITAQDIKDSTNNLNNKHKGKQAVFDVIMAIRAGKRTGSASTKTRAEVKGTSKKPWRQKGTGRARAGDKKSNIWTGGGVTHGPRPRSYKVKVNKKVNKIALSKALTERVNDGDVIKISGINISDGKTKSFTKELANITDANKVIFLADKIDEKTLRASRNIPNIFITSPNRINVEQLLYYQKVIFVDSAFETFSQRIAITPKNNKSDKTEDSKSNSTPQENTDKANKEETEKEKQ